METQILDILNTNIKNFGGKLYKVGGIVRDGILGFESKDLDLLVTGIPIDRLVEILSKIGKVDAVGKSFGVLKFQLNNLKLSEPIDIAIPRVDRFTGEGGHKGFEVVADHELSVEDDLFRRDFTINAIAIDVETGEKIDPFNGQNDVIDKTIRMVNPDAFVDDPLRMLRAVQFASRFDFTIEKNTFNAIRDNAHRIKEITGERILIEFDKIARKGNAHHAFHLLHETNLYENIFDIKPHLRGLSFRVGDIHDLGSFFFAITRGILNNPHDFFKEKLSGDNDTYKFIKALDFIDNVYDKYIPVEVCRIFLHKMNKISKDSIFSPILPKRLLDIAVNSFHPLFNNTRLNIEGAPYPLTLKDLNVDGNDLMEMGLKGKEIGDTLESLLFRVYDDTVENKKDDLLRHLWGISDIK